MHHVSSLSLTFLCALCTLVACSAPSPPEALTQSLNRTAFQCFTVNEAARTVADLRIQRKTRQLKRIERLLKEPKLLDLDRAKLRSERAVLISDRIDSAFHIACADAYYAPGSTKLHASFKEAPSAIDLGPAGEVFEEVLNDVPERMHPHGFENRAQLFLAEVSLQQGRTDDVIKRSELQLKLRPGGLYADNFKLLIADAYVAQNKLKEALDIYEDVARIRIGFEAHYARYRAAIILKVLGKSEKGDLYLEDVLKWAKRGSRQPLARFLNNEEPRPPKIQPVGG